MGETTWQQRQREVLDWVRKQWPGFADPIWRAAKLGEEAGEVLGAVIKSQQGVGGKTLADVEQETAQLVICAMALAESVGFDLSEACAVEWQRLHVAHSTSGGIVDMETLRDDDALWNIRCVCGWTDVAPKSKAMDACRRHEAENGLRLGGEGTTSGEPQEDQQAPSVDSSGPALGNGALPSMAAEASTRPRRGEGDG